MRRVRAPLPELDAPAHLGPEQSHYLLRVLRLAPGTRIQAFDGSGRARAVELSVADGVAVLRAAGPVVVEAEHADLHLVLGLAKGPATERAVRMATELGATHIHLVPVERSVARRPKRERWLRIATEAARQCGRSSVPLVADSRLHDVAEGLADVPTRWVGDPAGAPPHLASSGARAVAVGPEGGFTSSERALLVDLGWVPVCLGPWVLRADTAAAAALALLTPP